MDEASVSPLGCISTVTGGNNSNGYSLPGSVPSERRGGRRAPAPRKPTQLRVPGRDGKEASSFRMNSASKPVKSHGRAISGGIWTHSLNKHPPRDTDSMSLEADTAPGAAGGGGPPHPWMSVLHPPWQPHDGSPGYGRAQAMIHL